MRANQTLIVLRTINVLKAPAFRTAHRARRTILKERWATTQSSIASFALVSTIAVPTP